MHHDGGGRKDTNTNLSFTVLNDTNSPSPFPELGKERKGESGIGGGGSDGGGGSTTLFGLKSLIGNGSPGHINHGYDTVEHIKDNNGNLDIGLSANGTGFSNWAIKIPDDGRRASSPPKDQHHILRRGATWVSNRARSQCCTKRMIQRRLPITRWLPRYTLEDCIADLVAGVTVTLTVLPQAIAYAGIAGLAPEYGLHSSFLAGFIYMFLGSSKDCAIAPAAALCLMMHKYIVALGPDVAILMCFVQGIAELIMGVFHLGFIIDFISLPVTAGFTTAAAFAIILSNTKGLFGIKFQAEGLIDIWTQIFKHINETKLWDAVLGFGCIVVVLSLRKLKDIPLGKPEDLVGVRWFLSKFFWLVSTARNAIAVIICTALGYYLSNDQGVAPFHLTGHIREGLPSPSMPPLSLFVEKQNRTLGFGELMHELGFSIVAMPLVAILENVAIAKTFDVNKVVEPTQEMIALGVANIIASFFHSIPVTGSFSLSAVNATSGVRTQLRALLTGILVILALTLLTPQFYYIPSAVLSAVIISAVIFMVEYHVIKPMWKSSRFDLIPFFATMILCLLFGLEIGILCGVVLSFFMVFYIVARPSIKVQVVRNAKRVEYVLVTPTRCLVFPSADYFTGKINSAGDGPGRGTLPVVVDFTFIRDADFTSAIAVDDLLKDFKQHHQALIFINAKRTVAKIFHGVCKDRFINCETQEALDKILENVTRRHSLYCPPREEIENRELKNISRVTISEEGDRVEMSAGDSLDGAHVVHQPNEIIDGSHVVHERHDQWKPVGLFNSAII